MEDTHIVEPNFDDNTHLFAIFDGHGGKNFTFQLLLQ